MIVDEYARGIANECIRPGQLVEFRNGEWSSEILDSGGPRNPPMLGQMSNVVKGVEKGDKDWREKFRRLEESRGLPCGFLPINPEALSLPPDFVGLMTHSTLDPSVISNEGVLTLKKLNEFAALVFGQSYLREKPLPTIDLMNALTKLFLPENTRTLLEAGYVDTNMTLTPKGRDALNAITLASNMEALLVSARESIAEAKADKE